jgi:hypothetical protein
MFDTDPDEEAEEHYKTRVWPTAKQFSLTHDLLRKIGMESAQLAKYKSELLGDEEISDLRTLHF